MKWILTILVLVCARASGADVVTLAWDASTSGDAAGYRVYYGTNATALSYVTNVGSR